MCRQLEWLRYRDLTEFGTEQEFVAALLAASECTRMDGRPKILSSQNSIPFHPALAAYRAAYCDDRSSRNGAFTGDEYSNFTPHL